MSKKFDVVIGNPPYQEEAQGTSTRDVPIYNHFMNAAYEMGEKVILITPARFLFNAGLTPKKWNEKMLNDSHLSVPIYVADSGKLFPGTDIKGGIAVTYRDTTAHGDPIGTFSRHSELNEILKKVRERSEGSLSDAIASSSLYRYTESMHANEPHAAGLMSSTAQYKVNTNAFEQLHSIFHEEIPDDGCEYTLIHGLVKNKRRFRWIKSEYITRPSPFYDYTVAVPAANGSGTFGEVLSNPVITKPNEATTQSFINIGSFSERSEAEACLSYLKTKFARAMLSILKITQHNLAKAWRHVPSQDFSSGSDIDWTRSIPEIDQQLYAKYSLSEDEIAFIDTNVKPMS